jgi:hypothetical protein
LSGVWNVLSKNAAIVAALIPGHQPSFGFMKNTTHKCSRTCPPYFGQITKKLHLNKGIFAMSFVVKHNINTSSYLAINILVCPSSNASESLIWHMCNAVSHLHK